MSIGITKRALLEDYYLDELGALFDEHNIIHAIGAEPQEEEVDLMTFLGGGGEMLDD